MGGKSTQTQQSQSEPWAAAQPAIKGILGQLEGLIPNSGLSGTASDAITQMQQNAQAGNPFAGQITDYTTSLLNGGGAMAQNGNLQSGLDAYNARLAPYANGSMIGNNPALKAQLDTLLSDVSSSVNGQFAAAGRDMSGMNQQTLSRGFAQGAAPIVAAQYNQDVQNQLAAAGQLYNAQNSTSGLISGLNQADLANKQQGLDNSTAALEAQNYGPLQTLKLEQLKQSLPAETLGLLAQIGIPIAGLGGTQSGTSTNQMSGAQQFATIASGISSLFPKTPVKV